MIGKHHWNYPKSFRNMFEFREVADLETWGATQALKTSSVWELLTLLDDMDFLRLFIGSFFGKSDFDYTVDT